MNKRYTIDQFRTYYPDNDACLDKLFQLMYNNLICPKCDSDKPFTKVNNRRSYQCHCCGFQVYTIAGTVFEKSRTPLTHWFYLIFLQTTTRHGVAAKEVERQLNVCCETALRMCHQVKRLMANEKIEKLTGIVEADESYFGMKAANMTKKKGAPTIDATNTFIENKTGVMGFISRDGLVRTEVMFPGKTFKERVRDNVSKEAFLIMDSHIGYQGLNIELAGHETVNHDAGEYRRDNFYTNTIEGFWSQLKRTIKAVQSWLHTNWIEYYTVAAKRGALIKAGKSISTHPVYCL